MSAPTYGSAWPKIAQQWDAMERIRLTETQKTARRLLSYKDRYVKVEQKTDVPWYLIACLHYRESDADFTTQLAQGDPLVQVSIHVPKGMGPYYGADAWERAALEALEHDGLEKVKDWRLEKCLYYAEKWNGWGYYNRGRAPSPYVWAGSDQYTSGKYIADGSYSAGHADQQLGCAPILKTLMELDPTIQPIRETTDDVEPLPDTPVFTITVSPPGSARVVVVGASDDPA